MALNTTIFSGSGSANNVANQTAAMVLNIYHYAMYCINEHSCGNSPSIVGHIVIIVKDKKLQTNNNIFLINLLLADVGYAVVILCVDCRLILLYLLDVNVDVDCTE